MAAPSQTTPRGSLPLRSLDKGTPGPADKKHVHHNKGKGHASAPGDDNKGNAPILTPTGGATVLNPPFDPRMRKIGSPLNLSNRIRRGWIQNKDGTQRVNFLYNPSELGLEHSIDSTVMTEQQQKDKNKDLNSGQQDQMNPDYVSLGSSLSVQLLYDRTYELFSAPRSGDAGLANQYGVFADIAAWYTFLGMYESMPTSWENSIISRVPRLVPSFLFIGLKLAYYGWVNSISVTISHWSQDMVPMRCAITIGWQILPYSGSAPALGRATPVQDAANKNTANGWANDIADAAGSLAGILGNGPAGADWIHPDSTVGGHGGVKVN